jgi:hypothetical protein
MPLPARRHWQVPGVDFGWICCGHAAFNDAQELRVIYTPYTGPAKPIPTQSERGIFIAECVVFLLGILIVGLDVFSWRANIVL